MDEFNKIRELSEDIVGRKEPAFTQTVISQPIESEDSDSSTSDDAGLYQFQVDYTDKIPTLSFDDLEEKSISSMKLHIIALSIFVGILVVVLTGFFFFGENDEELEEIVTIAATPEPVKVRPEQPGGMVIPDQDKLVYSRLRANEVPTKVEKLFPEPEKPVLPDILIEQNAPDTPFVSVEDMKPVNPLAEEKPQIKEETRPTVVEQAPVAQKKESIALPQKEEKSVEKVAQKKTAAKNKSNEKPAGWRVQLLSSSNKKSVERAWPNILRKNKALLSDMSYDVVSAKIAGKGTFYRLQVGYFSTRDMAASLCSKLKARGQECVPVKQ